MPQNHPEYERGFTDGFNHKQKEIDELRAENQRLAREIASMAQGVVAMADATRKGRRVARDKEKG